jgi:hypothetical protein
MLALIAAIVGASAVILGQLLNEAYKRHRDRQMTAKGIAALIHGTLAMTERRSYVAYFEELLRRLARQEPIKFERLLVRSGPDPITERYLDRVGLLAGDLPTRIAEFYQVLTGVQIDLMRLGDGEFDGNPAGAETMIRADIGLWKEFEAKAHILVRDLEAHASARMRWADVIGG